MKKVTILSLSSLFVIAGITTSCKSSKPVAASAPEPVAIVPVETPVPAPVVVPAPEVIDVAGINARVNEMLNKNAITFEIDKDVLSKESQANIDSVLPAVSQFSSVFSNIPVTINGYCDESGSPELNSELSKRRAESVKKYLASKGLKTESFQAVGLGFSNPVAPNTTPENRAKNRRAVFSVSLTEEVIREAKTKGLL